MRPAFEMSANTRLIRQRLAKADVGETIDYIELSSTISAPVTGATSALQSALRSLLRNERFVFANVRGVGVQRLADTDIVAAAGADVDCLRRRARKSVVKITAVSAFDKLAPAQQLAHTTRLSLFAAVADMTSDRGVKKLEKAVGGRAGELPISETLRAFAG